MPPATRALAVVVAAALLGSGCLSSTYRIPTDEALRLTQAPPGQRGQQVRVVQRWSTAEDPFEGDPPERSPSVGVAYTTPVYVTRTRRSSSESSGGGSGGSRRQRSAEDAAGAALAVVLIAAGAMAIVAGTEGARYDGWVRLDEREPLYLLGPGDATMRVSLDALRPEHVLWADEVVAIDGSPEIPQLGRAPLERAGFTYTLDLGAGALIALDGRTPWGFLGRLGFGGFPVNELGLLGSITFGYATLDGQTVFHARYAFEVHTYPLAIDPVHFGLHAEIGDEHRLEDLSTGGTLGDHGLFIGVGPLLQLDLTTRLALTLRGGLNFVEVEDDMSLLGDVAVGLAVY